MQNMLSLILLPLLPCALHIVQHRWSTLFHSQPDFELDRWRVRTKDLASARPICVSSVKRPMPSQVVRPSVLAWRSATSSRDLPSSGSPDQVVYASCRMTSIVRQKAYLLKLGMCNHANMHHFVAIMWPMQAAAS